MEDNIIYIILYIYIFESYSSNTDKNPLYFILFREGWCLLISIPSQRYMSKVSLEVFRILGSNLSNNLSMLTDSLFISFGLRFHVYISCLHFDSSSAHETKSGSDKVQTKSNYHNLERASSTG